MAFLITWPYPLFLLTADCFSAMNVSVDGINLPFLSAQIKY